MTETTPSSPDDPAAAPPARPRSGVPRNQIALTVAVLGLGLGFIFSYVGAFHRPTPHRVSIAVVAPPSQAPRLVAELNGLPGGALRARAVASAAVARGQVRRDVTSAALVVDPRATRDRLLVATGGGAALASAVQTVVTKVEAREHRRVAVSDIVPLQGGDYRGLTGFYAVVGWLVSGYLLASLLGIASGARVSTVRSVSGRLGLAGVYAVAAGLGGALIIDTLLGAVTGHFLGVAAIGALLVFAAAAVTIGLQELVGIIGIGLTIILFVIVGNPSAGGAYQLPLLPGFWRTIGDALPNGAGVDAIRRIVYFGGHGIADRLLVIAAYALAGVVLAIGVAAARARRLRRAA